MQKWRASYSRDGRWIYMGCPDGSGLKICRMPAEGGAIEKISKGEGTDPTESLDGKLIYFTQRTGRGIWSMPAAGGDAVQVTDKGRPGNWALAQSGLYFADWDNSPTAKPTVYHYSFRTKRSEPLFPLSKRTYQGPSFSVSPDERSILIALVDESGSDLMMIENFR
jgi:hypothetical protein